MQKITTTQELTKTMISKLTHFPLLFFLFYLAYLQFCTLHFLPGFVTLAPPMLLKSFADSGSTRYSSVVCANRNPHPNVKGINPQEKRKQERKERWVRGPHSLGAGRQRRAGVTGFREWEGVQQGSCLPGEVETEARRLAVVGSALEGWVCGGQE